MSNYIEINGRQYDTVTGLPVEDLGAAEVANSEANKHSVAIFNPANKTHNHLQKSKTLNRHFTKKSAYFVKKQLDRQKINQHEAALAQAFPNGVEAENPFDFSFSQKFLRNQQPNSVLKTQPAQTQKAVQKVAQKVTPSEQTVSFADFNAAEAVKFDYGYSKKFKLNQQEAKIKVNSAKAFAKTAPVSEAKSAVKVESVSKPATKASATQSVVKNSAFVAKPQAAPQAVKIKSRTLAGQFSKGNSQPVSSTHNSNLILNRDMNKRRINSIRPINNSINSRRSMSDVKKQPDQQTASQDIFIKHPAAVRAQAIQKNKAAAALQKSTKPAPVNSSVLKNSIINETLAKAPAHNSQKSRRTKAKKNNWVKFSGFASGFAAVALFAGYMTYLNIPDISVRVAASQAGINATYPDYKPDGYKLNGPVAFSKGEVSLDFKSNVSDSSYKIHQTASSWDSNALLENYVKNKSNNIYSVSREKGITVYTFNNGEAAWVDGGILYTLSGNAELSPDQIRKIATSA